MTKAEKVCQALVDFDLEAARTLKGETFEQDMGKIECLLYAVVDNLEQYKPYLPNHLFVKEKEEEQEEEELLAESLHQYACAYRNTVHTRLPLGLRSSLRAHLVTSMDLPFFVVHVGPACPHVRHLVLHVPRHQTYERFALLGASDPTPQRGNDGILTTTMLSASSNTLGGSPFVVVVC